jgi:hypothetical protein
MANKAEQERITRVNNLYTHLKARWEKWRPIYTDIGKYIDPAYEDIRKQQDKGKRQGLERFDGTASEAAEIFANGFAGNMVNQADKWFRFKLPDEKLNDMIVVKRWLEDAEKAIYNVFNNSNFYREVFPFIKNFGTMCTSFMTIDHDPGTNETWFTNIHTNEFVISIDGKGKVDGVIREYYTTINELATRYGLENLPKNLQNTYKTNPFSEERVINAVVKRYLLGDEADPTKPGNANKPIASVVIVSSEIIHESGYTSFPGSLARYQTYGQEWYGRGPGTQYIAEIKGLNFISKSMQKMAGLRSTPPVNIPAEMAGKTNLRPFGRNYYKDPNRIVMPVEMGGDYPIGLDREEKKQEIVRRAFHVDFFLMLAQRDQTMTATEVIERQAERVTIMGPMIGRFTSEALRMILDRVYDIELAAGRIPPPPDIVLQTLPEDTEIDVEYLGPLAQAQRNLQQTGGSVRAMEFVMPVAQLRPNVLDNFDLDDWVRNVATGTGLPATSIKPKKEVETKRRREAAIVARQRQLETAQQGADVSKTLSEADKNTDGALQRAALAGAVPEAVQGASQ